MKLKTIAEYCGLTIFGNKSLDIRTISYAKEAEKDDLAVAFSLNDIHETKAAAVLTEPRTCITEKTLVYCLYGDIISAISKVADLLIKEGCCLNYNSMPLYTERSPGVYFGKEVVIDEGTMISPFTTIGDYVKVGKNCYIESNVFIGSGTIIGDNCFIHSGAKIGTGSFLHYEESGIAKCFLGIGKVILKNGVQIGCNSIIQRGTLTDTVIGDRTIIGNLVIIGHDVKISNDTRVVCQSGIAGGATIGAHTLIMGQSGIVNNVHIGDCVTILSKSRATKNVRDGKVISGSYGNNHKEEMKSKALLHKLGRR